MKEETPVLGIDDLPIVTPQEVKDFVKANRKEPCVYVDQKIFHFPGQ